MQVTAADQLQTSGSYLYEPSSSMRTFCVSETNTEDTTVFSIVFGSNVHFQSRVESSAMAQGIAPAQYLKSGTVGYAVEIVKDCARVREPV